MGGGGGGPGSEQLVAVLPAAHLTLGSLGFSAPVCCCLMLGAAPPPAASSVALVAYTLAGDMLQRSEALTPADCLFTWDDGTGDTCEGGSALCWHSGTGCALRFAEPAEAQAQLLEGERAKRSGIVGRGGVIENGGRA